MGFIKKKIGEVRLGDQIAQDLLNLHGILVAKKGTIIDEHVQEKLKKWGIEIVPIEVKQTPTATPPRKHASKPPPAPPAPPTPPTPPTKPHPPVLSPSVLQGFTRSCSERRTGRLLGDPQDVQVLADLLADVLQDQQAVKLLQCLEKVDEYSYRHSVDVCVLGALMGKHAHLPQLPQFVKGCLLHDIGKLKLPQEILKKTGELTKREFELVKKHTLWGEDILTKHLNATQLATFAKQHHERLDGSGYPLGLQKAQLSDELRILMIVDAFSALTLDRPYRQALPPAKALEILFSDGEKFEFRYLKLLTELLHIYPVESFVQLSNGKQARVIYVNDGYPRHPLLEEVGTGHVYRLPPEPSLTITALLEWDRDKRRQYQRQQNFETYLYHLVQGDKGAATRLFDSLTDGLRVEDIYGEVVVNSLYELGERWQKGQAKVPDVHVALSTLKEILSTKRQRYQMQGSVVGKIALVTCGNEQHTLALQILSDLLAVHNWKVYHLEHAMPKEDLLHFLNKECIKAVAFSITMPENVPTLQETVAFLKAHRADLYLAVGGKALELTSVPQADLQGLADLRVAVQTLGEWRDKTYKKSDKESGQLP